MRSISGGVVFALVLVLGSVAAASAADMCFTDFFGDTFVAKSFTLPAAGQCKGFHGYFANQTKQLVGNACGTSDNTTIRFNLQYSQFSPSFVYHAVGYLSRGNLTGQVEYLFDSGSGGVFQFAKIPCPPVASRPFN
jgi:hypothetical protein